MSSNQAEGLSVETGGTGEIPVARLFEELGGGGDSAEGSASSDPDGTTDGDEQRAATLLSDVRDVLFGDEPFQFEEEIVKQNLNELLVVLVAMREGETNGRALMTDLAELFGSELSPGTLYPRLHDLDDEDVLEMYELVRTKEYRVDDHESATEMVSTAASQHLALGLFLSAASDELAGTE